MKENKIFSARAILFTFAFVISVVALVLYIEIITPDVQWPADRKQNLEADLRPIKESIVLVLLTISGFLFVLGLFIKKKKG